MHYLNEQLCPQPFQLTDIMVELIDAGYTLAQFETAILAAGGNQEDDITEGIFNCIESRLSSQNIQQAQIQSTKDSITSTSTQMLTSAPDSTANPTTNYSTTSTYN